MKTSRLTSHLLGQKLKKKKTCIVAKDILHKFHGIEGDNFVIDNSNLIQPSTLQLGLNETRTILISTEFNNVSNNILWQIQKTSFKK